MYLSIFYLFMVLNNAVIGRNAQLTTLNTPLDISKKLSKNAFSFAMFACFFLP